MPPAGHSDPDPGRSAAARADSVAPDTRSRAADESSTGLDGLSQAAGLPRAAVADDPLPGMVIGGVRIVRLLAEGGMGRVYEGIQEQPARPVAVKVLRPVFVTEESRRRFRQEAEILGSLDHPGIARIHTAGSCDVLGTALPYLVMELVPGARTLVAHADAERLDVAGRVAIMIDVCDAVAAGHARGVVHRDLKPGNVLVDARGRPRVIDFGVARWIDASVRDAALTSTGQFIGTLRYTSPEQLPGARGPVDARADVYALGVMLHELFTGRPPHEVAGRSTTAVGRILAARGTPQVRRLNPAIPPAIAAVVSRCLAWNPADRFADAGAVAAALRAGLSAPAPRPLRRRLAVAGLLGGAAALPLAVAAVRRRDDGAPERTCRFDLREPPGPHLVRADRARIYREPFGAVLYWAPTSLLEWAEVVYRIDAPFPIAAVDFHDIDIYAANVHCVVEFDTLAQAVVDVSPDGTTWTRLNASTPTAAPRRRDEEAAAALVGSRSAYLRARLFESTSFNGGRVHYAQFLRSEPDLGRIPSLTLFRRAADRPAPAGA